MDYRTSDEARTTNALALIDELAAYVLDGEPCPERCTCGSEDGLHEDPASGDGRDALTLFVQRARHARACSDASCTLHGDALFCETCESWVEDEDALCPGLIEEPAP